MGPVHVSVGSVLSAIRKLLPNFVRITLLEAVVNLAGSILESLCVLPPCCSVNGELLLDVSVEVGVLLWADVDLLKGVVRVGGELILVCFDIGEELLIAGLFDAA